MATGLMSSDNLIHPNAAVADLSRPDRPVKRIIRRFARNRLAVVGLFLLIAVMLSAVFAPQIAEHGPRQVDLRNLRQPPSAEHILGGDTAGRDVFARVVHGGRISLTVGLLAVAMYVVIGTLVGLVSGYYGGWVDSLLMRITDAMLALPALLLALMLVTIAGSSLSSIIFAIGVSRWPSIARLVRGQVLAVREMEYVSAARCLGAGGPRIMLRHILPNVFAPVIVAASFGVASAILTEASLSFLGLGVPPPAPSWGQMLNQAQSITVLSDMPWFWIPPGVMIAVSVLSINFVGDGLRDALDPRSRIGGRA